MKQDNALTSSDVPRSFFSVLLTRCLSDRVSMRMDKMNWLPQFVPGIRPPPGVPREFFKPCNTWQFIPRIWFSWCNFSRRTSISWASDIWISEFAFSLLPWRWLPAARFAFVFCSLVSRQNRNWTRASHDRVELLFQITSIPRPSICRWWQKYNLNVIGSW